MIFSNPCARVKPPKVKNGLPRYLDEVESAKLLELFEAEEAPCRVAITVLLFTGMRRGGLLGHASAATTTKIYAHAIQSADAAAAELLQNLLNPKMNIQ